MGNGIPRTRPLIQHYVHPGAVPWVPSPETTGRIEEHLRIPVVVEWVPRAWVRALWERDNPGKPFPGMYAFRAYSRGPSTKILVDHTETKESALWVLLHELAHTQLETSPLISAAYRSVPRSSSYVTSDAQHEAWPEEQLANLVANQWATSLGSRPGLDRAWWRRRVNGSKV